MENENKIPDVFQDIFESVLNIKKENEDEKED